MELSGYTITELIELRDTISNYILNKEDGFLYINRIYSYGRSYDVESSNLHSAMELSDEYTGDNGITGLYTNNPNATGPVYDGVFFINSKEEYDKWMKYVTLKSLIKNAKYLGSDELEKCKNELEILQKEVVEPKLIEGSGYYQHDIIEDDNIEDYDEI